MNDFIKIQTENLNRIQFDKFEKDFLFIVNGKTYKTNSFVANILSPHISKMTEDNMQVFYYEINTKYEGDFNQIIEFGEMKTINVSPEEKQYFGNILKLLGNNAEAIQFYREFEEEISFENVIQRINTKKELEINIDEEVKFISKNFHDFHIQFPEAISELDIDIIERIISNQELKLQDEIELFEIILKLYIKSSKYSILFSYVHFINLPYKSIREFTKNFDINDINNSIWEKICTRLEQDISKKSKSAYRTSYYNFFKNRYFGKMDQINIIEYLTKRFHGNIHTQNVVQITSSSVENEKNRIENSVDKNDSNYFATHNEANSWIQFDFKEKKILLDSYTLKTYSHSENYCHIKSWILEVSNDGENYKEIDRHENCDLLNGCLNTATFNVSCSTPIKFVRLKAIGPNWCNNNYLVINQIEFSGCLDG